MWSSSSSTRFWSKLSHRLEHEECCKSEDDNIGKLIGRCKDERGEEEDREPYRTTPIHDTREDEIDDGSRHHALFYVPIDEGEITNYNLVWIHGDDSANE